MFQSLSSINIFHHVISWLYYILAANMFQIHLEIWSACNIQLALSETLPNKFYQFYYNQFRTHSEALVLIGTNMWRVCYSSPPLIMSFSPKANSLIRSDFRCRDSKILLNSPPKELLPSKSTPLIRPDFRCTEIAKSYLIVPLKRESETIPLIIIKQFFHFRKGGLTSGGLLYSQLIN